MINLENLFAMTTPSKAFEALSQGKVFDVKAQSKLVETSANQAFGLVEAYQTQTRKALNFYLDQSEAAVKEGQKFVKEWVAAMTEAEYDLVKDVKDNLQEVAKAFELPKPAKTAKAA